ncbi:NUDIX domain-containing protein, partial [Acinetobacter baumannii]
MRELKEESGLVPVEHVYYSGMISGKNSMIHVITVPVDRDQPLQPREGETEIVSWHSWDDVEKDPRLLPNLRIAVPLLQR